jgi:erythromycin esterase
LVEFLVTQLGFTVFALEVSYAACRPINDYVLHGSATVPKC